MRVDLNCDMGESFGRYTLGNDAAMLDVVTSANIACGMHAGDPTVMARTVHWAAEKGVAIGAHPGYPDLQGFGRRHMSLSPNELRNFLIYQVSALAGFARAEGVTLTHVKPHGALYNRVARDKDLAASVTQAIADLDPTLIITTQPGSMLALAARGAGLNVAYEGFVDRAYNEDGTLVSRSQPGAVIHDVHKNIARAVRMVTHGEVETITEKIIPLKINTLCIHGDTPGALAIAQQVRQALEQAGVMIKAMSE